MNTISTQEQKIENAKKRILEFDGQIDGPNKVAFALASNTVLRENILRARRYLIKRRGQMAHFLLKNQVSIPTRGI